MILKKYNDYKFGQFRRERRGIIIQCKTCKIEFYVFPKRIEKGQVKYCSMKCYDRHGTNNPFYGKKHNKEIIEKLKNHPNRPRFTSENNPNYIRFAKGIYEGKSIQWWKINKNRISSVCEICRFSDRRILLIHHKNRNRKDNRKINLQILCPNCHAIEHYNTKTGQYSDAKWKRK